MFLDSHPDHTVTTPFDHLHGWAPAGRHIGRIEARYCGVPIPCSRPKRPDVAAFAPGPFFAFGLFLDLPALSQSVPVAPGPMEIEFYGDGLRVSNCTIQVADSALADASEILANRQKKWEFILNHANRPLRKPVDCRALSGLPASWMLAANLESVTDRVSSHEYGLTVLEFLNDLGPHKFVLDAGAGLRKTPYHNVVNMEIYDYPSTDILAIGQDLPFEDNSFDGALSLAVLEHVDDPFLCARELVRVVKPGGKILVIIPFLQPEHGFPSHFFNATRFGMRKLFSAGTRLEKHFLELSNHPIFAIHHLLSLYAAGLGPASRRSFMETTIEDLLSKTPTEMHLNAHEFVTDLEEEMQWTLASGTTAIFMKESP